MGGRVMTLIDAHQHFWDPALVPYPWMDPGDAVLYRRFGPEHVAPHLARHGIDGTVLVQSADNDEDTDAMFTIAAAHPEVWGVVGYVPLEDPQRTGVRLAELRTRDRFAGIRNLIHDRPDPDWLLQPAVIESLGVLQEQGVPFDLVAVLPRHLEVLLRLRDLLPDLPLVIDHLGKPPFDQGNEAPWHRLIAEAAALPNVFAKISGLYPPLRDGAQADLRPLVDRALELFGAERLMLGSDWPIAEIAGGFDPVWSSLTRVVDGYDPATREMLRSETARRFYGLAGHARGDAR
jgi:L-fuconolactonase